MNQPLANKVAVITAGASGIGRATAIRLARDGAFVTLMDIDEKGLAVTAESLSAEGYRVITVAADCTAPKNIAGAFKDIRAKAGEIDILVNNVGQSARAQMTNFMTSDLATLDFIIDVNLKSCILCTREVVESMCARRCGKIINLASESAVNGSPQSWDYAAAKAGVIGFTRTVARELAPFNVNINAVGPGLTRTPNVIDSIPTNLMKQIIASIPMARVGEPEDIANAIAFFASDQSDYITGQTLLVNGGNWML